MFSLWSCRFIWYESWWRFQMSPDCARSRRAEPANWHPNAILTASSSPDFTLSWTNVNRKRPGYVTEMYGWYSAPAFLCGQDGKSSRPGLLEAFDLMKLTSSYPRGCRRAHKMNAPPPSPIAWDPPWKRKRCLEYARYKVRRIRSMTRLWPSYAVNALFKKSFILTCRRTSTYSSQASRTDSRNRENPSTSSG